MSLGLKSFGYVFVHVDLPVKVNIRSLHLLPSFRCWLGMERCLGRS